MFNKWIGFKSAIDLGFALRHAWRFFFSLMMVPCSAVYLPCRPENAMTVTKGRWRFPKSLRLNTGVGEWKLRLLIEALALYSGTTRCMSFRVQGLLQIFPLSSAALIHMNLTSIVSVAPTPLFWPSFKIDWQTLMMLIIIYFTITTNYHVRLSKCRLASGILQTIPLVCTYSQHCGLDLW